MLETSVDLANLTPTWGTSSNHDLENLVKYYSDSPESDSFRQFAEELCSNTARKMFNSIKSWARSSDLITLATLRIGRELATALVALRYTREKEGLQCRVANPVFGIWISDKLRALENRPDTVDLAADLEKLCNDAFGRAVPPAIESLMSYSANTSRSDYFDRTAYVFWLLGERLAGEHSAFLTRKLPTA